MKLQHILGRALRRFSTALLVVPLLAGGLLSGAAWAGGTALNVGDGGVALQGYDAVAYHVDGAPTPGSAAHAFQWQGVAWHFSSAANRDRFAADPAGYAPQYGGYCAIGTKMGLKLDVQPDLFKVVDGRLYLNSSPQAHDMWLQDIPGMIKSADANWPKIRDQSPEALKAQQGG